MKEGLEEPQTSEAWAGGVKVTGASCLLRKGRAELIRISQPVPWEAIRDNYNQL